MSKDKPKSLDDLDDKVIIDRIEDYVDMGHFRDPEWASRILKQGAYIAVQEMTKRYEAEKDERIEPLIDALKFYADKMSYDVVGQKRDFPTSYIPVERDMGEWARQALRGFQNKTLAITDSEDRQAKKDAAAKGLIESKLSDHTKKDKKE